MRKKLCMIMILAALVLSLATACQKKANTTPVNQTPEPHQERYDDVAKAEANLSEDVKSAQMDFSLRMLQTLNEAGKDKNIVISPYSISTALGMTYFGAQGETAAEMAKALGIDGLDALSIASGYKQMAAALTASGDTEVHNANAIWVDEGFPVEQGFINTMEKAFLAGIENIDLQGEKALPTINGWIKDRTGGMIDKLFESPFDPLVSMVLCNAIYFDGQWTVPFDPERTSEQNFAGQKGDTNVKMMSRKDTVLGKDGDDYRSVMLPYGDDKRFAMVAVLPDGETNDFIAELDDEDFAALFEGYEEKEDARLFLPVFTVDEKVSLSDTLKAMGMELAFIGGEADFSAMGPDLFIGDVLHRARIEVDEKGTKAAAVTGVMVCNSSLPQEEPWTFRADKPFLCFIYDSEQELVLFATKVIEITE